MCSLLEADEEPMELRHADYSETIKIRDRVVITAVINEECIYIRRLDCAYAYLANDVIKHAKSEVGDLVLARLDEIVYRSTFPLIPEEKGGSNGIAIE
jgi:hypothetical protein